MTLQQKTALVTGASSGFGKAICIRLIHDGYKVIGLGRRSSKLKELHKDLGDAFLPLSFDIRNAVDVSLFKKALPDDFKTMTDTNITGIACMTHVVLPDMVAREHGLIINMGSVAGT